MRRCIFQNFALGCLDREKQHTDDPCNWLGSVLSTIRKNIVQKTTVSVTTDPTLHCQLGIRSPKAAVPWQEETRHFTLCSLPINACWYHQKDRQYQELARMWRNMNLHTLLMTLFITAPRWKQPKCPYTGEEINTMSTQRNIWQLKEHTDDRCYMDVLWKPFAIWKDQTQRTT